MLSKLEIMVGLGISAFIGSLVYFVGFGIAKRKLEKAYKEDRDKLDSSLKMIYEDFKKSNDYFKKWLEKNNNSEN